MYRECEYDADRSDDDQLGSSVKKQAKARRAGGRGNQGDSPFHGARRNPALRAGSFGPEAVFAVASFAVVEQVVDQVCVNLHQQREQQAEQSGNPPESAFRQRQRASQQYGNAAAGSVFGRAASIQARIEWGRTVCFIGCGIFMQM